MALLGESFRLSSRCASLELCALVSLRSSLCILLNARQSVAALARPVCSFFTVQADQDTECSHYTPAEEP